jgi:hypothetical protein
MIQFTDDGVGPGPHQVPGIVIEGGIDPNHYGGSAEQLKAEWANGSAVGSDSPTTGMSA